jgi:hypothetical protein
MKTWRLWLAGCVAGLALMGLGCGGGDGGAEDTATPAEVVDSAGPPEVEPDNAVPDGGGDATAEGACTNAADDALLDKDRQGIEDKATQCGVGCIGVEDAVGCAKPCITKKTGLSDGCSQCYANMVDCTIQNCVGVCVADPYCEECKKCEWDMGCYDKFYACSGMPPKDKPTE